MMKKSDLGVPELSRPLGVDKISAGGMVEHIVARPAEREALAARFELVDLTSLEAWLNIDHAEGRMVEVTGRFVAEVVQTCVVSLEAFSTRIEDEIDTVFAPQQSLGSGPPNFDAGPEEDPEPIVNGYIDLGELVSQYLGVALDPYPRKPGAVLAPAGVEVLQEQDVALQADGAKTKPFANLASLCRDKVKGS